LAGDPLMDIAKALCYERSNRENVAAVFAGYGAIERDDWMETIDLYHLYFAVELWCWMAQIAEHEALPEIVATIDDCVT
jgi:hygromycin-B 7''-O-kinase